MYQVFNCVTGEAMPVLAESPYELAGPLAERREVQKTDEQGNPLYLDWLGQETTEEGADRSTGPTENGTPEEMEWVAYPSVVIDGGALFEWRDVVPTDAEVLAQAKQSKLWQIQNELDQLDKYLPRALEDYWGSIKFDVTTLPPVQQDRLARKVALRAAYAAVEAAETVAAVEAVEISG